MNLLKKHLISSFTGFAIHNNHMPKLVITLWIWGLKLFSHVEKSLSINFAAHCILL